MQWRDVRTLQLFPSPRLFGSFHFVEGSERTRTAVHPCHTRSEKDQGELLTRFLRGVLVLAPPSPVFGLVKSSRLSGLSLSICKGRCQIRVLPALTCCKQRAFCVPRAFTLMLWMAPGVPEPVEHAERAQSAHVPAQGD